MTANHARRISTGLVVVSVVLIAADGGVYLWLVHDQGDGGPAWWFLAGLCVALLLGIGSVLPITLRTASAVAAGVILLVLGFLGILSVGLPLLLAGLLMMIVAIMRSIGETAIVS